MKLEGEYFIFIFYESKLIFYFKLKKSFPLTLCLLYVVLYYFTHFTILNLLKKAKKMFKTNKVSDIVSASSKIISEGK